MRIVYVAYEHPLITPGGAQQVAYEMFQASLAAGHDAFFIAALEGHHARLHAPAAPSSRRLRAGSGNTSIPRSAMPIRAFRSQTRPRWRPSAPGSRSAPDVVHFHHYHRVGIETIGATRRAAPRAEISLTFHEMLAIASRTARWSNSPQANCASRPRRRPAAPASELPPNSSPRAPRPCERRWTPATISSSPLNFSPSAISTGACRLRNASSSPTAKPILRRASTGAGAAPPSTGSDISASSPTPRASTSRYGRWRCSRASAARPPAGSNFRSTAPTRISRRPRISSLSPTWKPDRAARQRRDPGRRRGRYRREDLAGRMAEVDWVVVPSTWWGSLAAGRLRGLDVRPPGDRHGDRRAC